jgi:2-dehydro-3-deoxyglucarate aldolase
MDIKQIRDKLRNGGVTIGSWMQISDSSIAEIMGCSGYDWVAVDLEHGKFSWETLPDIFRALELGNTQPFARVDQTDMNSIKQVLDAGATGLIFPMITNKKQLEQAIEFALYPPIGIRGVGYARSNLFGKRFEDSIQNNEILFVAQIESVDAVHNLDEILQVKSLDAIMVGPYDLSASMQLTGQFEHHKFLETLSLIQEKARKYKVPMGIHVVQPDQGLLKEKINAGFQFLAYSIDAVFLYNSCESPQKTIS